MIAAPASSGAWVSSGLPSVPFIPYGPEDVQVTAHSAWPAENCRSESVADPNRGWVRPARGRDTGEHDDRKEA